MRVRLTVVDELGTTRDVRVTAPEATTFDALGAQVRDCSGAASDAQFSSGRRRIRPSDELGGPGLREGDTLVVRPPTWQPTAATVAGLRLDVVGGPDAGHTIPLSRGLTVIGRGADVDLPLTDPDISRRHASVTVTGRGLTVHDLGSTNGTWLAAEPGVRADPTSALSATPPHRVGPDGIGVGIGQDIVVGSDRLRVTACTSTPASLRPGAPGRRLVNRAPRLLTGLPQRVVDEPPPAGRSRRIAQALAVLTPLIAGVALAVFLRNAQFVALALIGPLAMAGGAGVEAILGRRERRNSRRVAIRRASAFRVELAEAIAQEAAARRWLYPDPCTVARIAQGPEARIWSRRRTDSDALHVRLGLGPTPSATRRRGVDGEREATLFTDTPVTVALADGPLGLAGPQRTVRAAARWLVTQLSVLRAPSDVDFVVLTAAESSAWQWTRWLPHLRTVVQPSRGSEPGDLLRGLLELLDTRRTGNRDRGSWTGSWTVLIIDRCDPVGELPGLDRLLEQGPDVGLTAVCIDREVRRLHRACTTIAQVSGDVGSHVRLDTRGRDGFRVAQLDGVSRKWAESVARSLAHFDEADTDGEGMLPTASRLLDQLGGDDALEPLGIAQRWATSSGEPRTPIGRDARRDVVLDLAADGPHALIAGTTGSGKSELLQSLVAGLALSSAPQDLSFLLVDYKGGAAFAECAELPHTVGVVTDLDGHLTARALKSLDAEIHRRERLFAQARVSSWPDYRTSRQRDPDRMVALARLVVVVDEFATLAVELPAFVDGLVSVAQRGRSLGIHLVLATQRPAGVVSAQIRGNSAIRVALRVTDAADSLDIVDDDSAAHISSTVPGRAVLRTGAERTMLQVSRVAGQHIAARGIHVEPLDAWGRDLARAACTEGKTDLAVLVDAVREAAVRSRAALPGRPWLPPLPSVLRLSGSPGSRTDRQRARIATADPQVDRDGSSSAPCGLVDEPALGRQSPLLIDPTRQGTALFVGGPRSGRSTALQALAIALATTFGPDRLHVHLLDCAGGGLDPLADLAHVGTALGGTDGAARTRLMSRLREVTATRREGAPAAPNPPNVLLIIDGWEEFAAESIEHDAGQAIDDLLTVMRQGPAVGVGVAIAGDRGLLSARTFAASSEKYLFRLEEPNDYAAAGLPAACIPAAFPPGRAVRISDRNEVQFGLPEPADLEAAAYPRDASSPDRIAVRPLPTRCSLDEFAVPESGSVCWLGVGGDSAAPVGLDLSRTPNLLVVGPPRSGRTTLLLTLAAQLDCDRLLVVAPARSPVAQFGADRGVRVLTPASRPDEFDEVAGRIVLVDDAEAFLDAAAGDLLTSMARRAGTAVGPLAVVAAARTDDILVTFRGVAAEVRRAGCGILLRPRPSDGEILGVRLPQIRPTGTPGRGLAVVDPVALTGTAGSTTHSPMAIQVATR